MDASSISPTEGVMEVAARGINRNLLRAFKGDVSAAEVAIADLVEKPEMVEAWATRMLERNARRMLHDDLQVFGQLVSLGVHGFTNERFAAFKHREREGLKHLKSFSLSELPRVVRDAGLRGLVIAYLVETTGEVGKSPQVETAEVDLE